jgi:hypothetical protein
MFSLLWRGEVSRTARVEAPAFAASLGIAELLFKFHSFSLECLAFLATWFVLGGAATWVLELRGSRPQPVQAVSK